jgi:hypothetical protein
MVDVIWLPAKLNLPILSRREVEHHGGQRLRDRGTPFVYKYYDSYTKL